MLYKKELRKIIEKHPASDEMERRDKQSFLQFLDGFNEEEIGSRDNLIGHLTSSCWIVNKSRNATVMAHHNIFKSWAWLGGHADNDKDLLYVAKKEIAEESGLKEVTVVNENPIDISVLPVFSHTKKGVFVPSHLHFNVTYLLEADEESPLHHQPEENSGVKWIKHENVLSETSEECMRDIYKRIIQKIK